MAIKPNIKVNFDVFKELLYEAFFVKEIEEKVNECKKKITQLEKSSLQWSLEQKEQLLKEITEIQS